MERLFCRLFGSYADGVVCMSFFDFFDLGFLDTWDLKISEFGEAGTRSIRYKVLSWALQVDQVGMADV